MIPVRFSLDTRFKSSVSFCTRFIRGSTIFTTTSISSRIAATKPAVMADSSQLLSVILITAHTAITGAFTRICSPMDTSIWICVMSLVVRLIRLGTENSSISFCPKADTFSNTCFLTT